MAQVISQLQSGVKCHRNGHGGLMFTFKNFHHCTVSIPLFLSFSFFLTSAVIFRFISSTRWLFHISKHQPKSNNQKESEKINQCPQTTGQFWQVQFIHKSYSSLGILLSCIHNALDSDASVVSARWQPRWEGTHCSIGLFCSLMPELLLLNLRGTLRAGILYKCYPN